jgi:hypothetical protein
MDGFDRVGRRAVTQPSNQKVHRKCKEEAPPGERERGCLGKTGLARPGYCQDGRATCSKLDLARAVPFVVRAARPGSAERPDHTPL